MNNNKYYNLVIYNLSDLLARKEQIENRLQELRESDKKGIKTSQKVSSIAIFFRRRHPFSNGRKTVISVVDVSGIHKELNALEQELKSLEIEIKRCYDYLTKPDCNSDTWFVKERATGEKVKISKHPNKKHP